MKNKYTHKEHIDILADSLDKNTIEWKLSNIDSLERIAMRILFELLDAQALEKKDTNMIRDKINKKRLSLLKTLNKLRK